MKRVIAIIISAIVVLSLCACDSGGSGSATPSSTHIGEWHLDSFEWRSGEIAGLYYNAADLSLRADGSFSFSQTVVKDGETGSGILTGTYTLEGVTLLLRSTHATASGGGQHYDQDVSPARVTNATYSGDCITINFTAQDSPYFLSATLRK